MSYVYLMTCDEPHIYKVGYSVNPEKRLKEVKGALAIHYIIPCKHEREARSLEIYIHRALFNQRVFHISSSREWFWIPMPFLAWIYHSALEDFRAKTRSVYHPPTPNSWRAGYLSNLKKAMRGGDEE